MTNLKEDDLYNWVFFEEYAGVRCYALPWVMSDDTKSRKLILITDFGRFEFCLRIYPDPINHYFTRTAVTITNLLSGGGGGIRLYPSSTLALAEDYAHHLVYDRGAKVLDIRSEKVLVMS